MADEHLVPRLHDMLRTFESISGALSAFLDFKRLAYPRLYFIHDAALLEMLADGYARTPPWRKISAHVATVFPCLAGLRPTFEEPEPTALTEEAVAAPHRRARGVAFAAEKGDVDKVSIFAGYDAAVGRNGEELPLVGGAIAIGTSLTTFLETMHDAMSTTLRTRLRDAVVVCAELPDGVPPEALMGSAPPSPARSSHVTRPEPPSELLEKGKPTPRHLLTVASMVCLIPASP